MDGRADGPVGACVAGDCSPDARGERPARMDPGRGEALCDAGCELSVDGSRGAGERRYDW